ncbi:LuxR C-terminal-related transcriptional regulator [Microbacterium sp. BWR-S6Y]|uniref:helix-turn-helix transcriptional regulator n=1 Tax=Microbacterium sp. BWR-S6Y TaxID=3232073 RepID=UPI00352906A1
MPGSQTSIDARIALRSALQTTALRLPPGRGIPDLRHLSLLAEVEAFDPPRTWTDEGARTLAAMFAARARRDALGAGVALVARYFEGTRLIRPATLSMDARALLLASVGEYLCAVGVPQAAVRFGQEAQLFAENDSTRFYALTATALGYALNGEYTSADPAMQSAALLFRANRWPSEESSYLLLLARSLVSAARMDHDGLRAVAHELALVNPEDPYCLYSARAIDVMGQLIRGDYAAGLAASQQLLHGSERSTSHRFIRDFLLCIRSDILLAQGQYAESLASLATAESPEGHGICFAMQRGGALLLLGRERELLAETDGCVACDADHCLRTLTPLLLRRAIAFRRLGNDRRASQSMESALLLIARTGNSMTPFIMLPPEECIALVDAAVETHPHLGETAAYVRKALASVAAPVEAPRPSHELRGFTPTERALADLLLTPLSLADIARTRGVSLNTVKSQVRSIYLKLGVSARPEAVVELQRILA